MLRIRKRLLAVIAVFSAFFCLFLLTSSSVEATGYRSADFIVGVSTSLKIVLPPSDVYIHVHPGAKEIDSESVTIGLYTNSEDGMMAGMSTNKDRESDEDIAASGLVDGTGENIIQSLQENNVSFRNFPVNSWGYSFDGGASYSQVPAKNDLTLAELSVATPGESGEKEILFGVKADLTLPSDYYSNTVIFTAIAPYIPKTIYDIIYMQEMNEEVVDSMVVGTQYQLKDQRDDKTYWVALLEDGDVWMTQNLAYEIKAGTTLTPDDTDISYDWTPETDTIVGTPTGDDGWRNDPYSVYSYAIPSDGAEDDMAVAFKKGEASERSETFIYTTTFYTKTRQAGPDTVNAKYSYIDGSCTSSNCSEHYNVGVYYNWMAATAGKDLYQVASDTSVNVDQSICPAGWRLPTGSIATKESGEYGSSNDFRDLLDSYLTTSYYQSTNFYGAPLYLLNNGVKTETYNNSSNIITQSEGSYWTSTVHNASDVDRLSFIALNMGTPSLNYGGDASESVQEHFGEGRAVRCIARAPYLYTLRYHIDGSETAPEDTTTESWSSGHAKAIVSNNQYQRATTYLAGWSTVPNASDIEYAPGDKINLTNQETDLYAVWKEYVRFNFHAAGGSFDENSHVETNLIGVKPGETDKRQTASSHCRNANGAKKNKDDDCQDFGYREIRDITISGARKLDVTLYYATSPMNNLCIYDGNISSSSSYWYADFYNVVGSTMGSAERRAMHEDGSTCLDSVSGMIRSDSQFSKEYENVYRTTIYGDTVKIGSWSYIYSQGGINYRGDEATVSDEMFSYSISDLFDYFQYPFRGSGSIDKSYGYWAEIVSHERTVLQGEYLEPTREGYSFLGWSTIEGAAEPNWDYYSSSSSPSTELYAVWRKYPELNFHAGEGNFDNGASDNTIRLTLYEPAPEIIANYDYGSPYATGGRRQLCRETSKTNCDWYAWATAKPYTAGNYYDEVTVPGAKRMAVAIYYALYDGKVCVFDKSTKNPDPNNCHNTVSPALTGYSSTMDYWGSAGDKYYYGYAKKWNGLLNGDTAKISFYSQASSAAIIGYMAKVSGLTYDPVYKGEYSVPTRAGYTFVGWSTTEGADAPDWDYDKFVYSENNLDLYAVWKKNTTLTFNAGDGHFGDNNATTVNSMVVSYPSGVDVANSKDSVGSRCENGLKQSLTDLCKSGGSGTVTQSSYTNILTVPGAERLDITIYYSYGSAGGIFVSNKLNPDNAGNKGSLGFSIKGSTDLDNYTNVLRGSLEGDTAYIRSLYNSTQPSYGYWAEAVGRFSHDVLSGEYLIPERDGYTFMGWSTTAGATQPDWDYDKYEYYSDPVTLYAVWSDNSLASPTIKFHANSGNFDDNSQENQMTVMNHNNDVEVVGTTKVSACDSYNAICSLANGGSITRTITIPGSTNVSLELEGFSSALASENSTSWTGATTMCIFDSSVQSPNPASCDGAVYKNVAYPDRGFYKVSGDTMVVTIYNNSGYKQNYKFFYRGLAVGTTGASYLDGEYNIPTRDGYTFVGWATTSDAVEPNWSYNAGVLLSSTVGETNVYAVWKQNITVNFYSNGGVFNNSNNSNATWYSPVGSHQLLSGEYLEPTRSGYTFMGWATASDATAQNWLYNNIDAYLNDAPVVTNVYAVWKQNIMINFHAGDGMFDNSSNLNSIEIYPILNYQRLSGEYKLPTLDNYVFGGWTTVNGGDTPNWKYVENQFYPTVLDIYAVWYSNPKLIFHAVDGGYFGENTQNNTNEVMLLHYLNRTDGELDDSTAVYLSSNNESGQPKINIDDQSTYGNGVSYTKTATVPGATTVHVQVTYSTESTSFDWLCIYEANATVNDDCSGSISGKLGGNSTPMAVADYDVPGDTVQIYFRSDGSVTYYGYWAKIAKYGAAGQSILTGEILTPTRDGHTFLGWSTIEGATTPNWEYDTEVWYDGITHLYAVWD